MLKELLSRGHCRFPRHSECKPVFMPTCPLHLHLLPYPLSLETLDQDGNWKLGSQQVESLERLACWRREGITKGGRRIL